MEHDPEQKQEQKHQSGAKRYGLFGVSAYPERSAVSETQRQSMARWAAGVVALLAIAVVFLVVTSSNSGGLTVTFDSQGGSEAASQSIPFGGTVAQPDEVVRPGYTLVCWSAVPDGSQPWDFERDTVSESLTLYAVWEPGPE